MNENMTDRIEEVLEAGLAMATELEAFINACSDCASGRLFVRDPYCEMCSPANAALVRWVRAWSKLWIARKLAGMESERDVQDE